MEEGSSTPVGVMGLGPSWLHRFVMSQGYFLPCPRCVGSEAETFSGVPRDKQLNLFVTDESECTTACAHCRECFERPGLTTTLQIRRSSHQGTKFCLVFFRIARPDSINTTLATDQANTHASAYPAETMPAVQRTRASLSPSPPQSAFTILCPMCCFHSIDITRSYPSFPAPFAEQARLVTAWQTRCWSQPCFRFDAKGREWCNGGPKGANAAFRAKLIPFRVHNLALRASFFGDLCIAQIDWHSLVKTNVVFECVAVMNMCCFGADVVQLKEMQLLCPSACLGVQVIILASLLLNSDLLPFCAVRADLQYCVRSRQFSKISYFQSCWNLWNTYFFAMYIVRAPLGARKCMATRCLQCATTTSLQCT